MQRPSPGGSAWHHGDRVSADEASTIELYSPQLGLLDAATLPAAGAETAAKVRNPHLPSNELIRNRSPRP